MGILTVAVITQPFVFEGKRRLQQAQRGLKELLESVDTMIVIPNEKLLAVAKDAGFFESFRIADDVLRQGVQGISDIITIPGIINRDFADVKTTMAGMGHAVMGTAIRSGENRAIEAAEAAMASPLLEAGAIDGARYPLPSTSPGPGAAACHGGQRRALAHPGGRARKTPASSSAPCSSEKMRRRGQDHHGHRHRLPRPDARTPRLHAHGSKQSFVIPRPSCLSSETSARRAAAWSLAGGQSLPMMIPSPAVERGGIPQRAAWNHCIHSRARSMPGIRRLLPSRLLHRCSSNT